MATITTRKRANGTTAYRAEIRIKKKGEIIHQEAETFDQRKLAEAWAKRREIALQVPGALSAARAKHSIGELIGWYIEEYGAGFGRTKLAHLQFLQKLPFADLSAISITAQGLIDHVRARRDEGAGPSTVNNDLIWLRIVYRAARPALNVPFDLQVIDDAAAHCREQRLIAKSRKRDRRPTDDELDRLNKYFKGRDGRARIPMVEIMWFALHSTRREDELTQLLWSDNNEADMTGVVRDAKHPRSKEGNHRTFKYTPEAWAIAQRQPKTDVRIFPFKGKSIGAAFTRACQFLKIDDLVFHDLRHDGTSRLFEKGYSIQEVQQFTLHESWATLQRYTHLKPKDVKHR
jgi:integrase